MKNEFMKARSTVAVSNLVFPGILELSSPKPQLHLVTLGHVFTNCFYKLNIGKGFLEHIQCPLDFSGESDSSCNLSLKEGWSAGYGEKKVKMDAIMVIAILIVLIILCLKDPFCYINFLYYYFQLF